MYSVASSGSSLIGKFKVVHYVFCSLFWELHCSTILCYCILFSSFFLFAFMLSFPMTTVFYKKNLTEEMEMLQLPNISSHAVNSDNLILYSKGPVKIEFIIYIM